MGSKFLEVSRKSTVNKSQVVNADLSPCLLHRQVSRDSESSPSSWCSWGDMLINADFPCTCLLLKGNFCLVFGVSLESTVS